MQMSFGALELSERLKRDNVLMKIDALIKWEELRPKLMGLYKRELSHGGGQEPFDALLMFKAILLGQWHSLSDAALEQALCVRIDFLQFCGLSLSDAIPDETTLCRFRNRLVTSNRLDGLLGSINEQLQSHGLMIKGATGAVIDATLIESAARPRKTITLEIDTEGKAVQFEDGSQPGISCTEEQSADLDAAWLKKGKKLQFGYRSYLVVDAQDGYVRGIHTAPANQSEMIHFEAAIDGAHIEANRVYADKGSGSQCQSTVFKKAKDQERNHASRVQEQTAIGTPEAGESIDQQKALYCRTVFRHNQTLIQNGARQLLRYGKSQRPSHTEKYLHESEKSSQQNLRRSTIKGSNPSKCHIRGENSPKKGEKLHFLPK